MLLAFDIGGTKSAAITGREIPGEPPEIMGRLSCATDTMVPPEEFLDRLFSMGEDLLAGERPDAVGISCGGPLDSVKGLILGTSHLPGWDYVEIVKLCRERFGVYSRLQNDANAGALAEWRYGAGRGSRNMAFMTFGTGLGAGLILDGRLYEGTNGNAGECGHIRLAPTGPAGVAKAGSFEGFCSGDGIAQQAYTLALEQSQRGNPPSYYKKGMHPSEITARTVADAARAGDETALRVYRQSGAALGYGLSILIDVLNLEVIAIGSVFARARDLLWPSAKEVIEREALPAAAGVCRVVPAELGEKIGDYAALAVAGMAYRESGDER